MLNTNATNFRKNMFEYLDSAIRLGSVININTKDGNAVIMSEEDYSGLLETLYLLSHKKTADEIATAMKEPVEEGIVYDPDEEW